MARIQHSAWCDDPDYCRGECLPEPPTGLYLDLYGDPLQDREPMDPWWRERDL